MECVWQYTIKRELNFINLLLRKLCSNDEIVHGGFMTKNPGAGMYKRKDR
jgi:hypothetical protein